MPEPGDPCPGFIVDVGRCWQMVYDWNLDREEKASTVGIVDRVPEPAIGDVSRRMIYLTITRSGPTARE
jgi:hypothetical protein